MKSRRKKKRENEAIKGGGRISLHRSGKEKRNRRKWYQSNSRKKTCPIPDESNFESDDESEELEGGIFWKNFHRKISNCKDFRELSQIIHETEILRISLQRKMIMVLYSWTWS